MDSSKVDKIIFFRGIISAYHFLQHNPIAYTDFWAAYAAVLPSKRHRMVGKETGKTSYIERLNNTLRQRVSRLVRKALSFSKSLENHIGAIWYFVHYYNASLLI
jgi:IS1 family transposase